MPTFNDYETIGEPIESREESAYFTQVWQAGRIHATDGRLYAVKCYVPRQPRRAEGAPKEALEGHRTLEFLEGVKQIKKAGEGRKCLTPIHDFGLTPSGDGAWYVTDFYGDAAPVLPRTLRSFITRGGSVDDAALRHAIHSVVLGCLSLKRSRGFSHGNLKTTNLFRAGKPRSLRKTPLLLGDPYPMAPLLLARLNPQDKLEVGELLRDTMEAHDLRAIGELILQLVEVRLLTREGDYDYPVNPSPAWNRLGKDAERWRELCNRLLDPNLTLERMNLELLEKELRPGLLSSYGWWAAGAAVLLCLAVGIIVWRNMGVPPPPVLPPPPNYTVTASAGMNGSISPNGLQTVVNGKSIKFTATPASDSYLVDEWKVNSVTAQTNGRTFTLSQFTESNFVEVTFKPAPAQNYTVTASHGANGRITPDGKQQVVKGGSRTFAATPDSGYEVYQWLVNSNVVPPSDTSYTLSNITSDTSIQVTFKAATGSLQVTISPAGAIKTGVKWQADINGQWQSSGATVSNLSVGNHTVGYSTVSGWTSPSNQTVSISANTTNQLTGIYVQQVASLQVFITPAGALSAGVQWQVDSNGQWQTSGATLNNLPLGSHTVGFSTISGYTKPSDQIISISVNEITQVTGAYTQQVGSLQVTLGPPAAITAGAKWQLDGNGQWQTNGATVTNLSLGNHAVSFSTISGWITPSNQTVPIGFNSTSKAGGTYAQQFGSLQVTIGPETAVRAGARWQVEDGSWRASGMTASNLSMGSHTVRFQEVSGWTTPSNQTILVGANLMATTNALYLPSVSSNPPPMTTLPPPTSPAMDGQHPPTNFSGVFGTNIPNFDFVWVGGIGASGGGAWVAVNELSWEQYKALGGPEKMPPGATRNKPAYWYDKVGFTKAMDFVDLLNRNIPGKNVEFRLPGLEEYKALAGVPDFASVSISNLVSANNSGGENFERTVLPREITSVATTNKAGLRNVTGNVREWTTNGVPFGHAYPWGRTYDHSMTNVPGEGEQIGLRLIGEPIKKGSN